MFWWNILLLITYFWVIVHALWKDVENSMVAYAYIFNLVAGGKWQKISKVKRQSKSRVWQMNKEREHSIDAKNFFGKSSQNFKCYNNLEW